MNEKRMHDEIEIDLGKLFCALLSKAWLIALTAVVGAVITFLRLSCSLRRSISLLRCSM